MKKQFTTLKVGYTWGIYGCSNEYFVTIFIDKKGLHSLAHCGLYGSEHRVSEALKDKGYKEVYTAHDFGQMKKREVSPCFSDEKEAIEEIKKL